MKKSPRNKTVAKATFLMLVILMTTINCDNEIDVGLPEIDETGFEFSVEEARSWFEMNNVDIVMMNPIQETSSKSDLKAKSPRERIPFDADWSNAITTHKGHLEVVEMGLLSKTILWYATNESKQKWKETNNPGYRGSLSRLVIIKNTKEDWIQSYIMTIIGETSYLESKKFNLYSNTYLKKDCHFAGSILFHRLSGDYVNGWAMEKGKVNGKIIKKASNVSAKRSNQQVAFDIPDCAYYPIHQMWEVCDLVPDYGGDGILETIDETCYIVQGDLVDIMSICVLITEEPPYAGPGNEGNGSSGNWDDTTILFEDQQFFGENLDDYLDCFNISQTAQITVYAKQPIPNSSNTWTGTIRSPEIGHSFISITQSGITRVLGYYPQGDVKPVTALENPGYFVNDQGYTYHVSLSKTVSGRDLGIAIDTAKNWDMTYNLNDNNCTDFAIDVAQSAGFSVPSGYGGWPGFGNGNNPGVWGQNMRSRTLRTGESRNTTGGSGPSNSGGCP